MSCDIAGRLGQFCLLLTISLVAASPAFAKDWVGGTGNWSVSTNWSPAAVPQFGEAVNIVNSADNTSRTVTLDVSTPPTGTSLGLVSIDQSGSGGTAVNTLSITSNVSMTAGALLVGGYTGSTRTAGRGAVFQSAGAVSMAPNLDLGLANGGPATSPATAASTGTYTLTGGTFTASQSEFIGYGGNGTFNQSGGTNTINAGGNPASTFNMGALAGSNGAYNLSGGQLSADKTEVVGEVGTGIFTQSGGTNTLLNSNSLYLGRSAGGNGTYTASSTPTTSAVLNVGGDVNVGVSGTGTLNVQGTANVNITGALNIGAGDHVNLSSGTLRFNGYSRNASGVFTHTGGQIQLAGNRVINSDPTIVDIFGPSHVINGATTLAVEGQVDVDANMAVNAGTLQDLSTSLAFRVGENAPTAATLTVSNGGDVIAATDTTLGGVVSSGAGTLVVTGAGSTFTAAGTLTVGPHGNGAMQITSGGAVTSGSGLLGNSGNTSGNVLLSGSNSSWTITNSLTVGGTGFGILDIGSGTTLSVGTSLNINSNASTAVTLNGGTLRLNALSDPSNKLQFNTGTIQLIGNRDLGNDPVVSRLFGGSIPAIGPGRNLTIEGAASVSTGLSIQGGTLKANSLTVGAPFQFSGGVLEMTGGSLATSTGQLAVPSGGEFRALGTISQRISGAAGSFITATGNLTLGTTNFDGFYTDGTMNVGTNSVTLIDLNDAVFDSGSIMIIGSGVTSTTGSLTSANGLTLDFGGNFVGYGMITTPNNSSKPLINNGHINGFSAGAPITLPGYVKGVGTFDQVVFTGTYSPGFSPASVSAGSLAFGSTSTLVMELGGTAAGSQYDQILATGALAFGGTLDIDLINSFTPAAGNSFNLFDWGSVSGTFTLSLPSLGSGLAWNTSQLYTTGVLSVVSTGTPGDYNNNGTVDAGDYILWRKYQNTTHVLPNDPTGGTIGAAQYATWRSHFGQPPGSGSTTSLAGSAVPEPGTLSILPLAAVGLLGFRRDRATAKCRGC